MTDTAMVVLQDSRLDPDRFILDGVDASGGPEFNVSSFAKFFFARSSFWVRWLEANNRNVIDGDINCAHSENGEKTLVDFDEASGEDVKRVVASKDSWIKDGVCTKCGGVQVGMRKGANGYRTYNLGEIEQVTHAFLRTGAINGAQATNALHLVQTMAKIHGLIS